MDILFKNKGKLNVKKVLVTFVFLLGWFRVPAVKAGLCVLISLSS